MRLAADITPLRASRGFRWLYAGQVANMMGTQVAQVAVSLQVYALTRSSLAVGLVGLAALAPLIVFGLYGGSIADAIDRRLLVLITSTGSTATAALLLAQAVAHLDQVWLLYVCVAVLSAFFAVDNPTRRAAVPRLVGLPAVPAANTLLVTAYNLGIIGGPLVAGALVGAKGYVSVYALDTAAFVITVGAISRLPPIPPTDGGRRAGLSAVLEGLTYLRSRPVLLMAFAVDINAMVFGMPRALFPALAAGQFHSGPQVAGYLYAAPAVGALMVTVLGGWLPTIRRLGLAVLVAVAVWGAAITAFGLVRALWLALIMLAVAGAADSVSAVFRASILQLTTPDAMRGRMSGVYTIVVAGGPRLGDLEAGGVATAFTPTVSVVSGGLACLAGVALLALAVPAFARYHVPQSPQESPAPALLPVCSCLPVDTRRCRADDCRLNSERKIRGRSPMTDAPGASVRWNAGDAPDGAGRAKAVLAKAGRYHHGDLRAALIDTAIELITECGVHNFSLAEASRRLGVTVAAPYRRSAPGMTWRPSASPLWAATMCGSPPSTARCSTRSSERASTRAAIQRSTRRRNPSRLRLPATFGSSVPGMTWRPRSLPKPLPMRCWRPRTATLRCSSTARSGAARMPSQRLPNGPLARSLPSSRVGACSGGALIRRKASPSRCARARAQTAGRLTLRPEA